LNFKIILIQITIIGVMNIVHAGVPGDSLGVGMNRADDWFGEDKIRHVAGSMIATTFTAQIAMRQFEASQRDAVKVGIGLTFSLGLVKESIDRTRPNNFFSWKDLTANLVGITLGVLLLNL